MEKLPRASKSLKNFILGEDAKIIDKIVTKVALSVSLGAFIITGIYAGGGPPPSYYTHTNNLILENGTSANGFTVTVDPNLANNDNSPYTNSISASGKTVSIDVAPKSVQSIHANHYNHSNGGGGKS